MHPIQQAQMHYFHRQRQERFGEQSVEALGWKNIDSQQKRFEVFVQLADFSNSVILDVGCGYGDLKAFLDQRFSGFVYIGIDQNSDFIKIAKERYHEHTETHFVQGSISNVEFKGIDYVLASGALSYHAGEESYHFNLLDQLYQMVNKGLVFNLLDDHYFPPHPILKAHDRKKVLHYCQQWRGNLRVIDGYLEDDFTIMLTKE